MRRALTGWIAIVVVLLVAYSAFAGPTTVVLAVEGMT